jgi:hypothetical protein
MSTVRMHVLIDLQNAITYLDGQVIQGQKVADKAKLKPATRLFLRNVLGILQPVMKAYADELADRVRDITGGAGTFTPDQQVEANRIDGELRALDIEIRLPKKKLMVEELNIEDNQTPITVLRGLEPVVDFPADELEAGEAGETGNYRDIFKTTLRQPAHGDVAQAA